MKKMVYVNLKMNFPSLGGSDVHSHEILKALKEMGYKLYLFILEKEERPVLTRGSWGYEDLYLVKFSLGKKKIRKLLSEYIDKIEPQFIFINYIFLDFALDHFRYASITRIIHNHHFESLRQKMGAEYDEVWNKSPPSTLQEVHPELYCLDFFEKRSLRPDPEEYRIYDQYDLTLTLPDCGEKWIKKHCKKTQVVSFPICLSAKMSSSNYEKIALFTMSPYNFNFQGYYFFVKKVLPILVKKNPFFRVHLIGLGSSYFLQAPHIICKRFVPDLEKEYQKVSLSLCPSFGGTGQQVKIIESMHYAVPVVCMQNNFQYNPIEHGKTGFIAKTAEEFAHYTLNLFQNRDLAQRVGKKAQECARKKFSSSRLKKALEAIEEVAYRIQNYKQEYKE